LNTRKGEFDPGMRKSATNRKNHCQANEKGEGVSVQKGGGEGVPLFKQTFVRGKAIGQALSWRGRGKDFSGRSIRPAIEEWGGKGGKNQECPP